MLQSILEVHFEVLIVFGFGLWLFSEMRIRQIDRQLAENQRFIDAILRVKK